MDSTGSSVFSATLQEITTTKLQELSKSRTAFEAKKSKALARLAAEEDSIHRLEILSQAVKDCFGIRTGKGGKVLRHHSKDPELEVQLKNLDSLLAQARYDPSLSIKSHKAWESSLLHYLDAQSLKYQYASLYAELVTEWLASEQPQKGGSAESQALDTDEALLGELKLQSRSQWEKVVFEAAAVDEQALNDFLVDLFQDQGDLRTKRRALTELAEEIKAFENRMASPNQFSPSTLKWVIQGLLSSDLLTDEKRDVLKSFQESHVILAEISDVLNMKIAALSSWSWGESVPLEQTRKISGIYNITMQEDVLQAIFLQYIGVRWSVFFKKALSSFRKYGGPWKGVRTGMSRIDKKRLGYYLGPFQTNPSVQHTRRRHHRANYFLSTLLDSENQQFVVAEGEEEAKGQDQNQHPQAQQQMMKQRQMAQMAQQPASMALMAAPQRSVSMNAYAHPQSFGRNSKAKKRQSTQTEDSETDEDQSAPRAIKKPMKARQNLLHILSTEAAVNTRIHGEFTAFRTSFESWNSLLPHATVYNILKFFGVSTQWLEFFRKFLEAPLRFLDDESPPRPRRRGTPASHVLSNVFGEVVLFCLDFSVNQVTNGSLLYRLFDDMWFWGPAHHTSVQAWATMKQFASVTGTELTMAKSGTVRISANPDVTLPIDPSLPTGNISWGFLRLSPETARFEINQPMVEQHIAELQKQLQGKSNSVFSFIQTWNTYAGTFFASNFGVPANCFGQSHVDMILETNSLVQREIFKAGSTLSVGHDASTVSVVDYLKKIIQERFNVSNIPDAWFFFPMELGGLDLQNPFIPTLQIRDSILKDPSALLDKFEEDERDKYSRAKAAFDKGEIKSQRYQLEDPDWVPVEVEERKAFMSFEEFSRWREEISYGFENELCHVYDKLLERPSQESLELPGSTLSSGLSALSRQQNNLRGILPQWDKVEPYWKWVAALYGPEVMERFRGLNIVDPGLLPIGMVSLFREKRVKW